jgi:hypothetical protein
MFRFPLTCVIIVGLAISTLVHGQTMTLSTSSSDYQLDPVVSDVEFFTIDIEIDAPLAPGVYTNPALIDVTYQVTGTLAPDTPSGFLAFNLQRHITGAEFYAQGSSLSFEIDQAAELSDGVQVAELVELAGDVVLIFNAREVDTGRYHPPLFELNSDGIGTILNSDNIPSLVPLVTVNFGEEYITDLMFDPGNTTVIEETPRRTFGSSSGCFIATVAYGSYMEPEVRALRNFRDKHLLTNEPGRRLVNFYYHYSPPVAAYIAERSGLRFLSRVVLTPLVYSVKYPVAALLIFLFVAIGAGRRFYGSQSAA